MGSERYVSDGYKPYLPLEERVAKIGALKGVSGVEITFPNDVNQEKSAAFKAILDQHSLTLCGMGVELVCDKEWQSGSFSSPDPKRREKAISLTRAAMDMAAEFGVSTVSLWLGQDGFDYVFQADYAAAWEHLVEGVRKAAGHRSDVNLALEYKTSEPKMACYVNSGGKALALAQATGKTNVGINLDLGHALNARENPAEIAAVLLAEKRLFHIHLNDNYAWADDDMPVGTVHLLQYVEFLYWLKKLNYDGWMSLDLYPYRDDPSEACRTSIHFLSKMQDLVNHPEFDHVVEANRECGSRSVHAIYELLLGK
jgi:xylose isomerase